MKNFVFISPNFPVNYWMFCRELKNNGLNVLGIGDAPYDELSGELKDSMNEYYKVNSLENYDEVYRAVAFFIFKHGRIDWLESNNEYWLERDAMLRTEFHITSGFQVSDIPKIKYKSEMKKYYQKAGIPTARYHLVDNLDATKWFANEVGYPVIVKPDNGVGANETYRLENDEQLYEFFKRKPAGIQFIMEQYIRGEVNSYDAIIDENGEPIFETGNITPISIMDIVNNLDNSFFYILKELPEDTLRMGRATVKSFGVKNRFIHFEFFRLTEDHPGLGKTGDLLGLEVNMRPSGGSTPDMIDFAHDINVYKIWADMIAYGRTTVISGKDSYCGFIGRRNGNDFLLNDIEIQERYKNNIRQAAPVPAALSGAMGNFMYLACFDTVEELTEFYQNLIAVREPEEMIAEITE